VVVVLPLVLVSVVVPALVDVDLFFLCLAFFAPCVAALVSVVAVVSALASPLAL
jgi:hypothetical protein